MYIKEKNWNIILSKKTLFKLNSELIKLYLFIIYSYQKNNNKIDVFQELKYLVPENKIENNLEMYKNLISLINKDNNVLEYIKQSETEILTHKEKLETAVNSLHPDNTPEYIIKATPLEPARNLLYELLQKASVNMWFPFKKEIPLQISSNTKMMLNFMKKVPNVSFSDIEKAYEVFITRVFDFSKKWSINNILPFVKFLEDLYIYSWQEKIWDKLRLIQIYTKVKWQQAIPITLSVNYKEYSEVALSIYNLLDKRTLENFQEILTKFAQEYNRIGYSWNLNTFYNKLLSDKEYIKYLNTNNNTNSITIEKDTTIYEEEFHKFLEETWENDKKFINRLYKIYKANWIENLKKIYYDAWEED